MPRIQDEVLIVTCHVALIKIIQRVQRPNKGKTRFLRKKGKESIQCFGRDFDSVNLNKLLYLCFIVSLYLLWFVILAVGLGPLIGRIPQSKATDLEFEIWIWKPLWPVPAPADRQRLFKWDMIHLALYNLWKSKFRWLEQLSFVLSVIVGRRKFVEYRVQKRDAGKNSVSLGLLWYHVDYGRYILGASAL